MGTNITTSKEYGLLEDILNHLHDKRNVQSIIDYRLKSNKWAFQLLEDLKTDWASKPISQGVVELVCAGVYEFLHRQESGGIPKIDWNVINDINSIRYELNANVHEYTRESLERMKDNNFSAYILVEALRKEILESLRMASPNTDYEDLLVSISASAMYKAVDNQIILSYLENKHAPQTTNHRLPK